MGKPVNKNLLCWGSFCIGESIVSLVVTNTYNYELCRAGKGGGWIGGGGVYRKGIRIPLGCSAGSVYDQA